MEFVRVDYKNNPVANAELTAHKDIIKEYYEKGYTYRGFVPVHLGPSGKILAIDLVFEKK